MTEFRKATDVILELEAKINALVNLVKSQDLLLKVLSNKFNILIEKIDNTYKDSSPKFIVEPADANVFIEPEIKIEKQSNGVRRISRPSPSTDNTINLHPEPEIIIPVVNKKEQTFPEYDSNISENKISVIQRVIDSNDKSSFLAEVVIVDVKTNETIVKTKTNTAGKWMTALLPGTYKVHIKKRQSITNKRLEASEDLIIDGNRNPLELSPIKVT